MPTRTTAPSAPSATRCRLPWVADLARHGERPALLTDGTLTYAGLAQRVTERAPALGAGRRVVLVVPRLATPRAALDSVVTYLAAHLAGHVVLLAPENAIGSTLETAYRPDTVAVGGERLRHPTPVDDPGVHDLHPDLALLLSTSGSTGSPKLVRLSYENLTANADQVAQSLGLSPDDVAATTLPLHYCYGLSVLHSHLAVGAGVWLTDASVTDPAFVDGLRRHGVTTFPGVPFTYEALERAGFLDPGRPALPRLRLLTQAGGPMPPDAVRRWARAGCSRRDGTERWDLAVMYGQTEATARMAVLPPSRVLEEPGSIGDAVPGGALRLEAGELVYSGPNVMLGYAHTPADLALGRTVDELRTGDLAERTPSGGWRITGRVGRFAKCFGLRIDLDRTEALLAARGVVAWCVEHPARPGHLLVGVCDASRGPDVTAVRAAAAEESGLPPHAVDVVTLAELPRTAAGKPDRAVLALATAGAVPEASTPAATAAVTTDAVRALYGDLLRREVRDDDSFVTLGGDSLSYVETSLRLERLLGRLPSGWHQRTIAQLAGLVEPGRPAGDDGGRLDGHPGGARRGRRGRVVETNVLLRGLAIVLIVGSHSNLFTLLGGAHVLLGLAGFNLGRFHMTDAPCNERTRRMLRSLRRIVVPSVAWLVVAAALSEKYSWKNVLLLNGVLGTRDWSEAWHYWFVEAAVATLLAVVALTALPWVDRLERRHPFALPVALALAGLLTRYGVLDPVGGDEIHRAHVIFWLFALGWAAAKATRERHRWLVTALVATTVWGFFDDVAREAVVVAGLLVLVWVSRVRVPAVLARTAGTLATASLAIYLVHWQVYPYWEDTRPLVATGLSLAAGLAYWWLVERTARWWGRRGARRGVESVTTGN